MYIDIDIFVHNCLFNGVDKRTYSWARACNIVAFTIVGLAEVSQMINGNHRKIGGNTGRCASELLTYLSSFCILCPLPNSE
jgi:hypothetical protein